MKTSYLAAVILAVSLAPTAASAMGMFPTLTFPTDWPTTVDAPIVSQTTLDTSSK